MIVIVKIKMNNFDKSFCCWHGKEITPITARDFSRGPFRITRPGRYLLVDDISFNPSMGPTSSDGLNHSRGWICAISIECSDVIFDLGGHCISQSEEHALQMRFFAVILLGSSLFELHTQGPFDMGGSKQVRNICVRNGSVGKSSHFGIFSPTCSAIKIEDLHCHDFEVAAIQLNRAEHIELMRIDAGPSANVPSVGAAFLHLQMLLADVEALNMNLEEEPDLNFDDGSQLSCKQIIISLRKLLETIESNISNGKEPLHGVNKKDSKWLQETSVALNGNLYGIAVNGSALLGGSLNDDRSKRANGVVIVDCKVHDLRSDVAVWPLALLDANNDVVRAQSLALPHLRINSNGHIILSPLTHAQILLLRASHKESPTTVLLLNKLCSGNPTECPLTISDLLDLGFSTFETDGMGHAPKGSCGLILHKLNEPHISNVVINNIEQSGRGRHEKDSTVIDGTASTGILLSHCTNVHIYGLVCANLYSLAGNTNKIAANDSSLNFSETVYDQRSKLFVNHARMCPRRIR